jgi:RES domain-containing protein
MLVHLESSRVLSRYVVFQVEIDDSFIAHLDPDDLPKNWQAEPAPRRLQTLGDQWLDAGNSVVLRVPNAIICGEFNYLLNPLHPDFSKLRIHGPEKFAVDKRLMR